MTQVNLALVYRALFGKDQEPRHLDDALEAVDGALEECAPRIYAALRAEGHTASRGRV
jgi:hypothetical protein